MVCKLQQKFLLTINIAKHTLVYTLDFSHKQDLLTGNKIFNLLSLFKVVAQVPP